MSQPPRIWRVPLLACSAAFNKKQDHLFYRLIVFFSRNSDSSIDFDHFRSYSVQYTNELRPEEAISLLLASGTQLLSSCLQNLLKWTISSAILRANRERTVARIVKTLVLELARRSRRRSSAACYSAPTDRCSAGTEPKRHQPFVLLVSSSGKDNCTGCK